MRVVIVALLSLSLSSCAWMRSTAGDAKEALIDCSKDTVITTAPTLVPVVVEILRSPSLWTDMLEAFMAKFGRDVVACAVQSTAITLSAQVPAKGIATEVDQDTVRTMQRARSYVNQQGWRFKESSL